MKRSLEFGYPKLVDMSWPLSIAQRLSGVLPSISSPFSILSTRTTLHSFLPILEWTLGGSSGTQQIAAAPSWTWVPATLSLSGHAHLSHALHPVWLAFPETWLLTEKVCISWVSAWAQTPGTVVILPPDDPVFPPLWHPSRWCHPDTQWHFPRSAHSTWCA